MTRGVPLKVKGVRPDALATAREAARRSGMSLGDWLNTVILDSAVEEGIQPKRGNGNPSHAPMEPHRRPAAEPWEPPRRQDRGRPSDFAADHPTRPMSHEPSDGIGMLNQRLDSLTKELNRLLQRGDAAPSAPPASPSHAYQTNASAAAPELPEILRPQGGAAPRPEPSRLTDAVARLDARLDQLITEGRKASTEIERRVTAVDRTLASLNREPPRFATPAEDWTFGLDRAVSEIQARQRELSGQPVGGFGGQAIFATPAPTFAPSTWEPAPAPSIRDVDPVGTAPSLSRLPDPPRYDMPIAAPPAQDLSGLEQQLRQLTSELETLRRPSGLEDAVAALRADLVEIGQTLMEALPRREIEALEGEVRALSQRLTETRQCGADAGTLAGLERGLAEIRGELQALTPAESLVGLNDRVKDLSRKIDTIGSAHPDPAALEQLEEAITTLRHIGSHVASNDALAKLADEVRGLGARIDQLAVPAPGGEAFYALERRIAELTDALDRSAAPMPAEAPQLDAVVASLTDRLERIQLSDGDHMVLGHLENRIVRLVEKLDASDARLSNLDGIERGLADLLIHLEGLRANTGGAIREAAITVPGVDALKQDIDALRQTERRTQDTLEAVHGTLGLVVDRLATIESDVRAAVRPASPLPQMPPAAPPMPAAPAAPSAGRTSAPSAAKPAAPQPPRTAPTVAVERRPIDPTLPPDHPLEPGAVRARGSAAERIAASEAALGLTGPSIPDSEPKNFIAAARRAAQAAAAQSSQTLAGDPAADDGAGSLSQRLQKHMRALLTGTGIVLLVAGGAYVGLSLIGSDDQQQAAAPQAIGTGAAGKPAAAAPAEAPAPALEPARPVLPASQPAPAGSVLTPPASGLQLPDDARPAAPAPSRSATPDVTGSVNRAQAVLPAPSAVAAVAAMTSMPVHSGAGDKPAPDRLSAAIGSAGLRAAATAGDAGAQYEIAQRYAEGKGVPANLEEAARWYERAANQGLAPAAFRLGSMYEKGQGVRKDTPAARRFYTAAADKGHAKAMHNLAVLHAEGGEGKPDFRSAAQWFRKAADRGVADSQYNLGILYARGIGVEQNLAESYKWFTLAAQQGDPDAAKKRDDVGGRLDQQSMMAAKLAAQTWTADPQPDEAITVKAPPEGWDAATARAKPVAAAQRRAGS